MLAIIADDLTGALDSAAPFASRGLSCDVAIGPAAIPASLRESPDVLAICLSTRELEPEQARQMTAAALSCLPHGITLFKKIDSRLKGHIAAELEVTPFATALAAPAIPEFGRIVRSGHVEGFGVDVPIAIADKLGTLLDRIWIPDTLSMADMRAAIDTAIQDGVDLLIGARGLAEALAERLSGVEEPQSAEIPSGPALFVLGSRDPITLEQVEALTSLRGVRFIAAPNGVVGSLQEEDQWVTVVQAVPGPVPCAPSEVSANLAAGVVPLLTERVPTLLLSGGATAEAVLARRGVDRLRLLGECLPGLGLARAGNHHIITKSGGFGTRDTLKTVAMGLLQNPR